MTETCFYYDYHKKENCTNIVQQPGDFTCSNHSDKNQMCKNIHDKYTDIIKTMGHKQVLSYQIKSSNYAKWITFICKHEQVCRQTVDRLKKRCCKIGGYEKCKATNLQKYGCENVFGNKDIQEKSKQTYFKKTGYTYNSQNPEIQKKREETHLKKTGYTHQSKDPKIKKQKSDKCLEKYGYNNPGKVPELRLKARQTYLEKTGYTHNSQNPETQKKREETCLKKYNCKHSTQNPDILYKIMQSSMKFKPYTFPSGRIDYIQGYENYSIDSLLESGIDEDDIITSKYITPFPYNDKVYIPDIEIKSQKKIIEVKSDYTLKKEFTLNLNKFKAVLEYGYDFELHVYSRGQKDRKKDLHLAHVFTGNKETFEFTCNGIKIEELYNQI